MLLVIDGLVEWVTATWGEGMVGLLGVAALLVAVLVVGPLAHELSHALVATLLGCRVIDIGMVSLLGGWYCDYERPRETWKIRVIGIAPIVLALAAAAPVWYLDLWYWSPATGFAMAAWLVWGFSGGLSDFNPEAGRRPARH